MQTAIEKLEESKLWIEQAITYIKKDTIEGYLEYFKVGYVSGSWHLPSIITSTNHNFHHRLAVLFNEQLKGTGFEINEEQALNKGNLSISFGNHYICSINLFKGSVYSSTDYQFQLENYQEKKKSLVEKIHETTELKRELEEWLLENDRPIKGLLTQKKVRMHKEALLHMDEQMCKEYEEATKMHCIYDNRINECKELLINLPIFLAVAAKYNISIEGYFNITRKRYSFFQLIDPDTEQINLFISKNNEGGIYRTGDFLALRSHFLKRFEIKEIRKEITLTPYEVYQPNFIRLLKNHKKLDVEIEKINFVGVCESIPEYMQTKLSEALNNNREEEIYATAKHITQEGYDISDVHFKVHGVNVIFDRFAKTSLFGESIENGKVLNSKPFRILLGME